MRQIILLTLMILINASAYARDKTLDDYMNDISKHPEVLYNLSLADEYRELSTLALSLPDPSLMIGVDNMPVDDPAFDRFLPTSKIFGFKQDIPNYSLRKARSGKQKQLSKKLVVISSFAKSRLESSFIATLLRLGKVRTQQELEAKQLRNFKELDTYFKGRLESGSGVYWRLSEVDVARSLVEQNINNLNAEYKSIEAELIHLVGEVPTLKIYQIDSKDWQSVDDLYPVKIAGKNILLGGHAVQMAKSSYGSNYGVQALYKQRDEGKNFTGDDWFSVQATFTVPLWYKSNQQPKNRAALAKKQAAEQALDNVKRQWLKKMTSLESVRDAALQNVHLLVAKDKAFNEMVAAAKRTYESGETSLDNLLAAKNSRLSIQSQLAEQRYKHMSLLAEINSYIGK
ncbi:MAG: cobalt-zinc-cadmium efflux system outer membrane protein [Alphaproteobacteria bacterium]